MELLLHISDFHFGKNNEEEGRRIRELADTINNEGLVIKQVIFTGDISDARVVIALTLEKLAKEHPEVFAKIDTSKLSDIVDDALKLVKTAGPKIIEKYNKYLKEIAIDSARSAADIINSFLKSIKVERDHFISCCGNHDRLRFLGKDNIFDCGIDKQVDEEALDEEYLPYNEFCKKINYNLTHKTQIYKCDELCYLIANSNWRIPINKETNNACINCEELSRILYDVEKEKNYKKKATIFLSHKPFDDICENAKYIYGGNGNYITIREHVERAAVMALYGDKHSYTVNIQDFHSEFICGLPLCNDTVHYNLINYSINEGVSSVSFMIYNNHHWILVPTAECVSDVYTLCKDYVKDFALQLICRKKEVPQNWEELFKVVDKSFNDGRFDLIRSLFRECATLYDFKQNKIPYKNDNIFEDILQLVNLSEARKVLGLKGEPGTGKSTFLSIQYIYMLRKFYNGDIRYIPFYFDLDILTKQICFSAAETSDIQTIIEWYCKEFSNYLSQVIEISLKYKLSPCIIIDGLDTNNMLTYTGHTVEHFYYKILEEKIKPVKGKYIMGLNTHLNALVEKSFEQANKFEYACFLNKVFIVSYKKREHHDNFIAAYLKLTRESGEKEVAFFYNILKKLRRISVDLDYIHGLDELLKDDIVEEDSWKVMKRKLELTTKRIDEAFGEAHKEILYKAAYLLFFKGNTYQSILNDHNMGELTYEDFLKIRNNPEMAKFLIARHYIQELKHYASCDEVIAEESILNCFISRDISVTIRLQIEDLGIQAQVFKNVVNKHGDNLQGYFKSFLIYLLGHNKHYNGLSAIRTEKLILKDDNHFLNACIERSYRLAEIVSGDGEIQQQKRNDFLLKIMADENFRLFNRRYQLWYYEDLKDPVQGKSATLELTKKIGKGFDFHNCFMFLISKIDYCFEHNEPYPLLEVDIFTLCDFIYSRLQNFNDEAMFYSVMYNNKDNSVSASVLRRIVNIIDNYFKKYVHNEQCRNLSSNILVYFEMVQKVFKKSLGEIEKRLGQAINEPFVSPAADFSKVINLCEMPRVGWNITKTDTIYKKDIPKYESIEKCRRKDGEYCTIFETIGQHILESIYIAELFLPERMQESGYDKSVIISMILMSEVGKIEITHDYTPDFYRASKILIPQENEGRKQFLIHGAFDGYANLMDLYDAMLIIGGTLEVYSDINMRISQEIKLIQMEYKFYTLKEQLEFEGEREADFKKEFVDLLTPICKDIRRMLITNNIAFRKYFET